MPSGHGPEKERSMSRRTALVAGSTDGICVTIACTLAAEGAEVIVSGRNAERGEQVVRRYPWTGATWRADPCRQEPRAASRRTIT